MNEGTLQLIASLKIAWLALFTLAYGSGGISGKWKRRFIGSFLLTLGIVGFSLWTNNFSAWYLLFLPLLSLSLSIGYGSSFLKTKILKRSRYGLSLALCALPLAIINQMWVLFGLHIFLCVLVSTLLGVVNPMKNARDEETVIATVGGLLPLYMI